MGYLAKFVSSSMAEIVKEPADQEKLLQLQEEGFVEFVNCDEPEAEEGQKYVLSYALIDGKVTEVWNLTEDAAFYLSQIESLKKELSGSDYKVLKCYEASLIGSAQPYDIFILTAERQAIRDQINSLESIVPNL